MKITALLLLLSVCKGSSSSSSTVVVQVGHDITLPCTYDRRYHGDLSMCWGRGKTPSSKCNNQLIATNGKAVTARASERYQLLGRLDRGDVSLTILNVTMEDSGQYVCRVEIPGWFNDQIHQIEVMVESARQTTTAAATGAHTTTELTAASHTAAQPTSTGSLQTSPQSSSADTEPPDSQLEMSLVFGLLALVAGLTVIALVFISIKMFKHWKSSRRPQWLDHQLHFSSSSSTLQLQRQSSAVDNVYQVYPAEDEGGVYESPP